MIVMESVENQVRRGPGRPLSFDRDNALDRAMKQFWKTGYETTSVSDLTNVMGITAPSLYAAFGNKESLFLECVKRYTNSGPIETPVWIRKSGSAREAAQQLMEFSAAWFTQPDQPAGCLVASAASSGSESSTAARAALTDVRMTTMEALRTRAERDKREGKLPQSTDPGTLASMTMAVIQGMSTLARDGADRRSLLKVASAALKAWPSNLL